MNNDNVLKFPLHYKALHQHKYSSRRSESINRIVAKFEI